MPSKKDIEQRIRQLNDTTSAELDQRVLAKAKSTLIESGMTSTTSAGSQAWRFATQKTLLKPGLAAASLLILCGTFTLWPSHEALERQWWLAPSAAWGQDILAALETIKGVTCRERTTSVMADGSEHVSSTWNRLYVSRDSYRRDIHDGDVLREIQWYIPDANGTRQTSIRFDLNSYFAEVGKGRFGNTDPVDRMRAYVGYLDRANALLGEKVIDGHPCVGFEISASQYGDNPEHWADRIWFDVDTKLPVLLEKKGRPVTGHPDWSFTTRQDQFDYDPNLPADTFIPWIPDGYIHAHPDDINGSR